MSKKMLVAVYGSLKSGFGNFGVMESADGVFIGKAETVDDNFIMWGGGYPFIVRSESEKASKVAVEVYEVPESGVHTLLDRLEGHPTFYKREKVDVITKSCIETAWIYIYQGSASAPDDELLDGGVYTWKESSWC